MVGPMREELVVVTGSAQARPLYLMDTQGSQLETVRFPQVKGAGTISPLMQQLRLMRKNPAD